MTPCLLVATGKLRVDAIDCWGVSARRATPVVCFKWSALGAAAIAVGVTSTHAS